MTTLSWMQTTLKRLGTLQLVAGGSVLIVLCAFVLVGALDLLLKQRVIPLDLLIGGLTALAIGPVFTYLPLHLARTIESLRTELDVANQQLRGEAKSLRHVSAELALANQRLGFAQALAKIAYFEVDPRSGLITGARELFKLFPAGAVQVPTLNDWRESVEPEYRSGFEDAFTQCAASAKPFELQFPLKELPEGLRWLSLYGEPSPSNAERVGLIIGVIQDITELRRAESLRIANERLTSENAALAESDRVKDAFLATMSHELRTPLTGVLSLSEALQEEAYGPLDEQQLSAIRIIENSGRHLLKLINEILDLAKIRSGKADVVMEEASLCAVARPAIATIHRLATDKGLELVEPDMDCDFPVRVDPLRFKQVLLNLLANAIKFTPAGGKVGIEFRHRTESDFVECTVWDTGIGIAEADLDKLFKPFVQLDNALARSYGGAGLGLCLALRLMELHGGRITVESQPGVGSRFTAHLPLASPTPITPERDESLAPQDIASVRGKVLLVEDNPVNRNVYQHYLRHKGFDVVSATDGHEALAAVTDVRPDVIVMDIQMPGIDGLETTRRLRRLSDPRVAGTPVIALTAFAMPGDEERCRDAGCDVYLAKPIPLEHLVDALQLQLNQRQARESTAGPALQAAAPPLS